MSTEFGVLVWVNEAHIDHFIESIQGNPDVLEYEISEQNEGDDE